MAGCDMSWWQHPPAGCSTRRATSTWSAQHHHKARSTMDLLQWPDLGPAGFHLGHAGLDLGPASLFLTQLAWFPVEYVLGHWPCHPMAGRRLWQAPRQRELPPKQGPSSGMSGAISLHEPPVSSVPRRAWPGPKAWGAPHCAGPHWARERESMAPPLHGTSGAGQPRALECSHPGAESAVVWCKVCDTPRSRIRPRMLPKEEAWKVPGVPHTGCPIPPGFSPSAPWVPVPSGAHCTLMLLLFQEMVS